MNRRSFITQTSAASAFAGSRNISNYTLIESILEKRSEVRLLGAMQARMGLGLAREHRPDLIRLNLQLPDFCGDKLLIQFKADERTRGCFFAPW